MAIFRYLIFKIMTLSFDGFFIEIFWFYFHRQEFARAKDELGSVGEGLHKMDDNYQKQKRFKNKYDGQYTTPTPDKGRRYCGGYWGYCWLLNQAMFLRINQCFF